MKLPFKIVSIGSSIALIAGMFLPGFVSAAGAGEIEGGNVNYTISNVTKGTGFSNTQSVDQCNIVEYRLHLYNPGPDPINDVNVEATINTITPYTQYVSTATVFAPDSLTPQINFQSTLNLSTAQTETYIKGSTVLLDSAGNVISSSANGTLADTITTGAGGINIGSLGASVQEYLEFKAQVNCPSVPTPQPTYACTGLTVEGEDNNIVKVTNFTTSQNNGADFTNATLNWGDNSTPLTTNNVVGQTHQYASNGTYNIIVTANFNVNGSTQSATSQSCEQQISFTSTPPTTPTTPTPTQLVNTGPGNVIAVFLGFSATGFAAFSMLKRYKLSRG